MQHTIKIKRCDLTWEELYDWFFPNNEVQFDVALIKITEKMVLRNDSAVEKGVGREKLLAERERFDVELESLDDLTCM